MRVVWIDEASKRTALLMVFGQLFEGSMLRTTQVFGDLSKPNAVA
jgi:hypothetical protein